MGRAGWDLNEKMNDNTVLDLIASCVKNRLGGIGSLVKALS